jgi:hypothetical protein
MKKYTKNKGIITFPKSVKIIILTKIEYNTFPNITTIINNILFFIILYFKQAVEITSINNGTHIYNCISNTFINYIKSLFNYISINIENIKNIKNITELIELIKIIQNIIYSINYLLYINININFIDKYQNFINGILIHNNLTNIIIYLSGNNNNLYYDNITYTSGTIILNNTNDFNENIKKLNSEYLIKLELSASINIINKQYICTGLVDIFIDKYENIFQHIPEQVKKLSKTKEIISKNQVICNNTNIEMFIQYVNSLLIPYLTKYAKIYTHLKKNIPEFEKNGIPLKVEYINDINLKNKFIATNINKLRAIDIIEYNKLLNAIIVMIEIINYFIYIYINGTNQFVNTYLIDGIILISLLNNLVKYLNNKSEFKYIDYKITNPQLLVNKKILEEISLEIDENFLTRIEIIKFKIGSINIKFNEIIYIEDQINVTTEFITNTLLTLVNYLYTIINLLKIKNNFIIYIDDNNDNKYDIAFINNIVILITNMDNIHNIYVEYEIYINQYFNYIMKLIKYLLILLYNTDITDKYNYIIDGIEYIIKLNIILIYLKDREKKQILAPEYIKGETIFFNNIDEFKSYLETKFNIKIDFLNEILIKETNKHIIEKLIIYDELLAKEDIFSKLGGGNKTKNNYKKTENQITVIYKKKKYTRNIYINNNKKYVKINKTFMLLSKLKKDIRRT